MFSPRGRRAAQECPPQCPAPGGKSKKSDCYAEFTHVPEATNYVKSYCTDGDSSCDVGTTKDQCDILVGVCLNNDDPRFLECTPRGVSAGGVTVRSKRVDQNQIEALQEAIEAILPADATTNGCSHPVTISVPVKKKANGASRAGTRTIKLKLKPETGKKDRDKLMLHCVPPPALPPNCPVNPDGGPSRLTFTVGAGADLDAGWSGMSHNFQVPQGTNFFVCLEGCDLGSNPVCTGTGETDADGDTGAINGETLGPPLPVGGDVPVCIVNEYREDIVLNSFDLQSGEASVEIRLAASVYASSSPTQPCPICKAPPAIGSRGRCVGGSKNGKRCVVEGLSAYGNVSGTCHPIQEDRLDVLQVDLDLTTGPATSVAQEDCTLEGNCHCTGQRKTNDCDTSCSSDQCPSGIETGVDQLCCSRDGAKNACFAEDITRTGIAVAPTPAWGDSSYPKTIEGARFVDTFCVPPSISGILTLVTGLPGPGAIILPGSVVLDRPVCTAGPNAGTACRTDDECPEGICE